MSLIKNYQSHWEELTTLERDCFDDIMNMEEITCNITISMLAETLNVSTTTIFRMVKKLGYESFMDFRMDLLAKQKIDTNNIMSTNDICNELEKGFHNTLDMLRNLEIDPALDDIMSASNVLICSSGMNNYIANILAVKLSLYGIPTTYLEDQWFLHLEATRLKKGDFVIVLSRSGTTSKMIDIVNCCKIAGCKILLISEELYSPLAKLSDYVMNVSYCEDEGYDLDSRLYMHIAIEYLLKELKEKCLIQKNEN